MIEMGVRFFFLGFRTIAISIVWLFLLLYVCSNLGSFFIFQETYNDLWFGMGVLSWYNNRILPLSINVGRSSPIHMSMSVCRYVF
jgi:hypothetical protein